MILQAQDEWDADDLNQTDYPVVTTPLVAAQRDYTFPAALKILKIKRVDITYDGTTYYKADPLDSGVTSIPFGNDTNIDANFTISAPRYDVKGNAVLVYPLATAAQVTAGAKVRIEYFREPLEFTSAEVTTGTKEPGFDEPFHIMVALGVCYDWFSAKDLNAGITRSRGIIVGQQGIINAELQDYEQRLIKHYGSKQLDRKYALTSKLGVDDYS